jgi:Acyltransferase
MTRAASRRGTRLGALPLTLLGLLHATSDAFMLHGPRVSLPPRFPVAVAVAISPLPEDVVTLSDVRYLSKEETNPLIRIGKGEKEKIINAFGLWCAAVSLVTGPVWMAAMSLVDMMNQQNSDWDPHRAWFDTTGKIWAKVWLTMTMSYPTVSGEVGWLKQSTSSASTVGPCLYVANHASWLDIPVLCTVLDPVFKFIAKGELRQVPCIGQQLNGVR